jgi:long-chain acyl-CoA synthetase
VASETTRVAPAARRHAGARTIPNLWRNALADEASGPAYLVESAGTWREIGRDEAATAVEELASGLLAIGVRKGDAFAILASTRVEWALFDFALAHVGAVTAPIYHTSSAADAAYIVRHSEAVGVLCEDEEQRAKTASLDLEHVLTFGDLDDLRARGREFAREHPDALGRAAESVGEDDVFTYIYTSGTTGPPKACTIRHRHYYSMAAKIDDLGDFVVAGDVMLLYLPLAHNFGRLMHLAGPYAGYTVAFCPDPYAVADALPVVRPTVLPSVPRVYEKIHGNVAAAFAAETGPKRRIIDWALSVGRRVSALQAEGRALPPLLAARHRLADRLVYRKVKTRLGGRLRIGISGGAPLAREIAEFFHALDILILEGYGLTECTTAATVNRPGRFRFGTVGPALPGVELRLADDGELLIRSDTVFAGYLKDEEATREVLPGDGWLHTGDVAEIDDDGFVTITDRKKDIIVTAGGKNVAPQNLENDLKSATDAVSQALVVGDRRPYLVALVTLDEAARERPDAADVVRSAIEHVNRDRSRYEQIKRFAILDRDFSPDEGEVTPTLKLRRRVVEEHFADEIEKLYP